MLEEGIDLRRRSLVVGGLFSLGERSEVNSQGCGKWEVLRK